MTRTRPFAAALATALAVAVPAAAQAAAAPGAGGTSASQDVGLVATLDGTPAEALDATDPLVLRPDRELAVAVDVTNTGTRPLVVRSIRLDGRVLGVTFIDYDVRVDAEVPPGQTATREVDLDLARVSEQAVGLLPLELSVLGADREALASTPLVVDARGGLSSAYGVFGLLVAVATALLLGAALVRLARGTLPSHRWSRAVRFAVPGVGVGLTATVTLSVLRVLVPSPGSAVTVIVVCGLVGLLLGFLTPAPDGDRSETAPSWEQPDRERAGDGRPADVPARVRRLRRRRTRPEPDSVWVGDLVGDEQTDAVLPTMRRSPAAERHPDPTPGTARPPGTADGDGSGAPTGPAGPGRERAEH
ncbi:hypothetical protein [Thalassiella azotivora]